VDEDFKVLRHRSLLEPEDFQEEKEMLKKRLKD
jgi:hypothetical protein